MPEVVPVLGNGRLIDTWPVRGGPVIAPGKDGKPVVYFAAGIWPFMGVFLHCLDAETGKVVWTNSGDGDDFLTQPHNTQSFSGIAPQGPLAVADDKLLIPNGRAVPACYDRFTGKFLYFQLPIRAGGDRVAVAADVSSTTTPPSNSPPASRWHAWRTSPASPSSAATSRSPPPRAASAATT